MKKRMLSLLLAILMVIALLPTVALAEGDTVSIGSVSVLSDELDTLNSVFEDFAEVSKSDDGKITIKLTQNIKGRIYFNVAAHFIFDANGKTISGQGQSEAICLENYKNTTVELTGGGAFATGRNNTIFVGSGNTLIVKDAVIAGKINEFGTVKTAPRSENAYYVVMINDGLTGLYTEMQNLYDSIEANDTLVVQPLVVEDGDEAIWFGGTNDDGKICGTLSEAIAASAGTIILVKDVDLPADVTLGTVTVDLNGKTLTIPTDKKVTVGAEKSLSVINTADSSGGLVVAGEVVANGNLNISSLAYGEGGLIKSQGGTLHIGAMGNVTLVPAWVNGDPNNFAILGTTEEGAKLTLGSKFYMYEEGGWVEVGSEKNPFPITSLADLEALAESVNSGTAGNTAGFWYRLDADIDLSDKYGKGKDSWTPIGTDENPFNANFDGNGNTITGLYCVDEDAGLFGAMDGSVVKNLTLSGTVISNGYDNECYAGLLAGVGLDVNVTNCKFSGIVQGYYSPGRGNSPIKENYGEIFGYEKGCIYGAGDDANDISGVVTYPAGHSVTTGYHIAYEIVEEGYDTRVRVLGKYPESGERGDYKGKYLATTYGHFGFVLATRGFDSDAVDINVSSVNGGRYAKISYTVNNVGGTEAIVGDLGMHADTQIGTNDNATVSVIKNDTGSKVIGLSLTDPGSKNGESDDAQFSLYFADVAGVDPELEADTYWFGSYTGAESNCFTQLANIDTPYSGDSGMAVSWDVDVPAGKSITYSVIVGAGAAAKPIKWAESYPLTWILEDNTLSVTANVVDESVGAFDTLFYNLDGKEMQFESVKVTNAAGTTITKEIELTPGNHVLYFYVGNDLGGFTTQKAVPVAVPDGNAATYEIDGTITSSPNIELRLMQGDEVIAQTITDEDGKYQFVNLPKGDYNLVIKTAEGTMTTVLVTVAGDVQAGTITPPAAESIVDNTNAGDYAATVGGLDIIAAAGSGDITLTVTAEEEDENDADQAKIVSIAGEQELAFIDITLTCSKNGDIGSTNNQLLSIVIPFDGKGKKDIQVYRYHDGEPEKMKKNPSGEEGFKYENGFVTIYARKFSTYAIGYTVAPQAPPSSGDYYPTTYNITVKNAGNGDVSTSCTAASIGSTVTVTPTPDKYYRVENVIVRNASGKEIETVKNDDGTYSFKMPVGKVTVEAVYVWENPFVDVEEDTFYINAVEWALKNGITEGSSEITFSPAEACTRAQMVTFLWRAAGSPEPIGTACDFTDVDMDSYYGKAVLWAVENGITNGTSDTAFSPDMECSRAQMAAFLCRMADGKAASDESVFNDVKVDAYYADSVQWAVENGITEGTGNNMYSPDAVCTRGQMVTFLYRYFVK